VHPTGWHRQVEALYGDPELATQAAELLPQAGGLDDEVAHPECPLPGWSADPYGRSDDPTTQKVAREADTPLGVLLQKVDGASERDVRLPRTPTGTNLIGIVKHCANVEYGYFGAPPLRGVRPRSG
jgi:hypothetical protein